MANSMMENKILNEKKYFTLVSEKKFTRAIVDGFAGEDVGRYSGNHGVLKWQDLTLGTVYRFLWKAC